MSLLNRLHGAISTPLCQRLRGTDGVRGVFSVKPLQRGELVLSLPLRYCYITQLGASHEHPPGWQFTPDGARQLRRWNRGVALLPEVWTWLQRFSCDAPSDVVSLTSSISSDVRATAKYDALENGDFEDSNSDDERRGFGAPSPSIFSMTVSPVEAALATAIALRYFYANALHLTPATRVAKSIGPLPNELAERFVNNLPLDLYLQLGVEAIYRDATVASGEAHLCLEQIAQNLRDSVLTHANMEEYRFLDEFRSLFDDILLVCLYVVRSRVLTMPLLGKIETQGTISGRGAERVCSVFAPLLDGLNHEPLLPPSAAVVVSLQQQRLVVRATRNIRRGEEVTLNYRAAAPQARVPPLRNSNLTSSFYPTSPYEMSMEEDWTSRYLMEDERW